MRSQVPTAFWRGLLISLLLGMAVALGAYLSRHSATAVAVGSRAPSWTLPDAQGNTVRLSDFRGRPTVLNFWATWCFPCREEMPLLAQAAQAHPEMSLIAINEGETPADVARFLDEIGVRLPLVVYDSQGAVATQYQVRGFPTTFFLDEQGVIRAIFLGGLDAEQLAQNLRTIGVQP